jgi:glycogen debranching enzyme
MTLFGRDSLIASWMALPLDQSLALGTLRRLARLQGRVTNPTTEDEGPRIFRIGNPLRFSIGRKGVNAETASIVYS